MTDTIVAVASPPGGSARGVVRLSGPRALELARTVAEIPAGRRAAPSLLRLPDLALPCAVWSMPGPASYTGDDVVEIHLPGSPPVLRLLVDTLVDRGARPAGPGEFTMRAYLHGKMDLAQAESVQSVIAARDLEEVRAARSAPPLEEIESALLDLCADVEASLDFEEGEPEDADRRQSEILAKLEARTVRRIESAQPTVLLWGVPNVGKSSLFNRLTGSDAIVSDVPGTTRDVLEGEVDGVRLLDAPGDHPGVDEADLLLVVVDATRPQALPPAADRPAIRVVNKCDLARIPGELCVSAKTGEGIDALRAALRFPDVGDARFHVTMRQQAWLRQAAEALRRRAPEAELRALDLRSALDAIGAITGRSVTDEILSRIFRRFCIGK